MRSDVPNGEPENPKLTILEQLGADAVDLIIQQLYKRILADPVLKPFFADKAVEEIIEHQKIFFYAALGGPDAYKGRDLVDAHKALTIEQEHLELLIKHLQQSLEDYAIDKDMIRTILKTISDIASEMLNQ